LRFAGIDRTNTFGQFEGQIQQWFGHQMNLNVIFDIFLGKIYTYIGPILVAVNPFSFFPIYNPKYSRLYCQSRRLGALPPHGIYFE
jgi:hypothetical protein